MFLEERHSQIMDLLHEKKRIEVAELTEIFGVSVDTIRRDLRILEAQNQLERTYGGALLPEQSGHFETMEQRVAKATPEKEAIGRAAAAFISDGDSLFFESSSTVQNMIHHLTGRRDLKIYTNCLRSANLVMRARLDASLFMIGGIVDQKMENTCSTDTLEQLRRIHVDKIFTGACSIHSEWGLSTPMMWEAPLLQAIFDAGREHYVLVDSSKFEKKNLVLVSPLLRGMTIITDNLLAAPLREKYGKLEDSGVRLIVAE